MVNHFSYIGVTLLSTALWRCVSGANTDKNVLNGGKYNALMITADDMRPEIGAYTGKGSYAHAVYPDIKTPKLDKLAARSLVLHRAYSQIALPWPSKVSMFTGRRPDTARVYSNQDDWREEGGNFTTLPQYFKEHGYTTVSVGDVFENNDKNMWSNAPFVPNTAPWAGEYEYAYRSADEDKIKQHPLEDDQIKKFATETLTKLAGEQNPFFMGIGFRRPSHPWICPSSYYDLYDLDDISLPSHQYPPEGFPAFAWSSYPDLRSYRGLGEIHTHGSINTTLSPSLVKKLRRAYYACVSYIDDLIGDVLHTVDKLNLRKNTIVVFLGYNGYQLGELGQWEKQTNFDLANHVPLLLSIPGVTDAGKETHHFVELVDFFSTIAEAAGLPLVPSCPNAGTRALCTEGLSFIPLVKNPHVKEWKQAAFSQFLRFGTDTSLLLMGHSMRTDLFRYTEWAKLNWYTVKPAPLIKAKELYDYTNNPIEIANQARRRSYLATVEQQGKQLMRGWRGALPKSEV